MEEKIVVVPEMPELTFDEDRHIYRLNGDVIPSVSTVMTPLKDRLYMGIREDTLERAANKGTSVHNTIENYIKFGIEDVNPEHKGYFEGFKEWWGINNPVVVGSEMRVYHKLLRFGGTIDLLAYINGLLTLVDYKSTSALNEMTCGVQLEAYAQALASHGIKVEQKMILHLKPDGKWKDPHFPVGDAARWRVFGSLKCVYDYMESYKK